MMEPQINAAQPHSGEMKGFWIEDGKGFAKTGHYYGLQLLGAGEKKPLKDVRVSFLRFPVRDGLLLMVGDAWPEGNLVPAIVIFKDGLVVKVREDPDNPQRIRPAIGPGGKGITYSGIRPTGTGVVHDVFFLSAAVATGQEQAPEIPRVFISYSHSPADKRYLNTLRMWLESLVQEGLMVTWHDEEMRGGEYFDKVIAEQMEGAAIILLLASPDFIASDYCTTKEVPLALRLHEGGKSVCMPIILRPCDWKNKPYAGLVCNPKDGRAISKWSHREDAYLFILENIRGKLTELVARDMG